LEPLVEQACGFGDALNEAPVDLLRMASSEVVPSITRHREIC